MKTISALLKTLFFGLILISSTAIAQKKDKDGPKKIRILPVYLVYNEIHGDTAFHSLVKEAFTRHKVKLIDKKEFDRLNDAEVMRLAGLIRTRQNEFNSERELRALVAKDQRFSSNLLELRFKYNNARFDSMDITTATFENTPCPPEVHSSKSSGDKTIELKEKFPSVREQVFAIVDEILNSKWLR